MNGLLRNVELIRKREEEKLLQESLDELKLDENIEEIKPDVEPIPSTVIEESKEHIVLSTEENNPEEEQTKDLLKLPLQSSRTQCLESPAFIPASAMPFVVPPSKLELETIKESQCNKTEAVVDLPLSPMCSHGKSLRSEVDGVKLNVTEQITKDLPVVDVTSDSSRSDIGHTIDSMAVSSNCDRTDLSTGHISSVVCVDSLTDNSIEPSVVNCDDDDDDAIRLTDKTPTMHSSLSANGIQVELANAVDIMSAKAKSNTISGELV